VHRIDFKADWNLSNFEDVGDIAAMLSLAMSVGFGVTRYHALYVHE
jgi:putative ABC transport system permease protein